MTYCGVGALSLLDRLPEPLRAPEAKAKELCAEDGPRVLTGLPSLEGTIRWLVGRQTAYFPDEDGEGKEEEEGGDEDGDSAVSSQEQSSDLEHEGIAVKIASERWP